MTFAGKTMFISGASRGIGLAIAKRVAADGANIALVAKTTEPHPKLPGTINTAAFTPDGKFLAWVESDPDSSHIRVAPLHNLEHKIPLTVAQSESHGCHENTIGWSPDSESLAYFSDCGTADHKLALYVARLFAPPARKIAEIDSALGTASFSPDGNLLAVLANAASNPRGNLLRIYPLNAQQSSVQISLPEQKILDFDWKPDSASLLLTVQSSDGATALVIYKISDGSATRIPFASPDPLQPRMAFAGRWSASGRQIAFLAGNATLPASLWLVELPSQSGVAIPMARPVNPGRPTTSVAFFWQGDEHLFVAERAGPNAQLVRYHLAPEGTISFGSPIFSLPGSFSDGRGCLTISADAAASLFVFSASTASYPAALYAARPSVVMGSGVESLLPLSRRAEPQSAASDSLKSRANPLETNLPWSCGKARAERRHLDR